MARRLNGDRVVSPRVVKTRFIARHPGEINPGHRLHVCRECVSRDKIDAVSSFSVFVRNVPKMTKSQVENLQLFFSNRKLTLL